MITEQDLQAAIAECYGTAKPNAKTCMMLAAFITIKNELYPDKQPEPVQLPEPAAFPLLSQGDTIRIEDPSTDFLRAVNGCRVEDVLTVVDDAMGALYIKNQALYNAVLRELSKL